MTLSISSQPATVIISGGIAGPAGVGVVSASLDANANLLLALADGTTLAPIPLATVIEAAVSSALAGGDLATLDAQGRLTLGGFPMLAADALGRLVIASQLPSTDEGFVPVAGSGVFYSNGGVLCVA